MPAHPAPVGHPWRGVHPEFARPGDSARMTEATVPFRAAGCSCWPRVQEWLTGGSTRTVGILYETERFGAYERIVLRRLPVTRLTW